MTLSLSTTSGVFNTQIPSLTNTGQTFDHDGDGGASTAEIEVFTFQHQK